VHRRTRAHPAGPPRRRAALSVLTEREEKASVAIACNEPFGRRTVGLRLHGVMGGAVLVDGNVLAPPTTTTPSACARSAPAASAGAPVTTSPANHHQSREGLTQ
jgi:hypothetical protein